MKNSKSRKLKVVSNLIGYIGVSVCLICAVAYLLLHQLGYSELIGPFRWESLALLLGAAVEFIFIAFIFRIAGIACAKKERKAKEAEANLLQAVFAEVDAAVDAKETQEPQTVCEAPADVKKTASTTDKKQKIVATVKKNAPVIAAVAATAAVCAVVGIAVHRHKKEKLRKRVLKYFR